MKSTQRKSKHVIRRLSAADVDRTTDVEKLVTDVFPMRMTTRLYSPLWAERLRKLLRLTPPIWKSRSPSVASEAKF